jgi:hypothetical protein
MMEKRKKGCAITGIVSHGVWSCQMRVAPHSLFLLPTISRTVWRSRSLFTRELSRGTAGGAAAPEDHPAPMVLRGAISQQVEGGSRRRSECKSKMDVLVLQKEVAAAMCCDGEKSAFSAKL